MSAMSIISASLHQVYRKTNKTKSPHSFSACIAPNVNYIQLYLRSCARQNINFYGMWVHKQVFQILGGCAAHYDVVPTGKHDFSLVQARFLLFLQARFGACARQDLVLVPDQSCLFY